MAEPVWYCIIDGQTIGPISRQEVVAMVTDGKLRRSDYVWCEGMTDWVPAGQVPEVFGETQPASIPPRQPGPIPLAYAPAAGIVYAGFWLRLAAWLLDVLIISAAMTLMATVSRGREEPVINLSALVGVWLYYALMESSRHQGTLGKLVLGLKVTDRDGNGPISFGRATGRHFSKFFSSVLLGIGYLMAGFTARKQALHDMIAGCLVLRRR